MGWLAEAGRTVYCPAALTLPVIDGKKFHARLQLPQREVKPVGRSQPASSLALAYQPAQQRQQVKVTVEDGRLGVYGSWVSVVSVVAAVIPVIVLFVR